MSEVIPKGWDTALLSEICSFAIGGTPSRVVPEYWDTKKTVGKPWVSIRDLSSRLIFDTSEYITELGIEKSNVKLVKKGTILMSFKLSVGRVGVAGRDLYTNEAIAAFIPKTDAELSNGFLYYGLQHWNLLENTDQAVKGVTLNKEKIGLIEALLPPLPEQQKIAAILSSVDDVIEKTRVQIDKLKGLKTGIMQELLTQGIGHTEFKDSPVGRIPSSWTIETLIGLSTNGISNGVFNDPAKVGSGYRLINVYDMYQGFGIKTNSLGLLQLDEKEFFRNKVEVGDVFFTRSSLKLAGIAHCNINLSSDPTLTYDGHIMRVRPDSRRVQPSYLAYYCLSSFARKFFMRMAKHSTMTTIGQADIAPLPVALPPLKEQEHICDLLYSIASKISSVESRLQVFVSLKKALMQDLLTGKVRVKLDQRETTAA